MEMSGVATSTPGALGDLFHKFLYLAFAMYVKLSGVAGHLQNNH